MLSAPVSSSPDRSGLRARHPDRGGLLASRRREDLSRGEPCRAFTETGLSPVPGRDRSPRRVGEPGTIPHPPLVRPRSSRRRAGLSVARQWPAPRVTHAPTGTKLRILSSSAKRTMGLATFSTIYADEPASWEERGGELMYHALRQSLGKRPGQRLVLIGTRAPAPPDSWWSGLLDSGSGPRTHVEVMTAPEDQPWDKWEVIRAANPMVLANPDLRRTILRERDDTRRNPTHRPAFEGFRLNRAVAVGEEMLVGVDTWKTVEGREVPPREGRPVASLDLGGSDHGRVLGACGRMAEVNATRSRRAFRIWTSASARTPCRRDSIAASRTMASSSSRRAGGCPIRKPSSTTWSGSASSPRPSTATASTKGDSATRLEPPREFQRPFCVSHAAMAVCSVWR